MVTKRLEALALTSGFQRERVRWLYQGLVSSCSGSSPSSAFASPRHLLYWMQSSVRTKYNFSLEYAIAAANALQLPLFVVFVLCDRRSLRPESESADPLRDPFAHALITERQARFALEGLHDVSNRLTKRGIALHVLRCKSPTLAPSDLVAKCAADAALIVTDRPYLRPACQEIRKLVHWAESNKRSCGVVQVEGDVVVPCEVVSNKEEFAARTIRPKITKQLDRFLVPLQHLELDHACRTRDHDSSSIASTTSTTASTSCNLNATIVPTDLKNSELDLANWPEILQQLDLDRSVKGVHGFKGGEKEANRLTKDFVENKLEQFANLRNEPAHDASSMLSLYLCFGHISPVRIALSAKTRKTRDRAGRESFLEELIVRRELSINMVVFNESYDTFDCLPDFAKRTLQDHSQDPRDPLYTLQQLEHGRTYDRFWNAAQLEMVHTGKMHGYMRMYWCKKILEWTDTPQEAFNRALLLNNKYALDAPCPNSYTGIAWSFGKHDQGWKERPIFGKVRYMNETGLKRKYDMDAYVAKIKRITGSEPQASLQSIEAAFARASNTKQTTKTKATVKTSRSDKASDQVAGHTKTKKPRTKGYHVL